MVAVGAACLMVAAPLAAVGFTFVNGAIAKQLGAGLKDVMIAFSIMTLTNAAGMIALAPWVAKLGTQRVIIVGGAWSAAMLFTYSFATQLWHFYVISFLLGVTFALATGFCATLLVTAWFEERRGTVQGLVNASAGLGGIGLGLVLPWAIHVGGWQLGYRLVAVAVAVLTIIPAIFLIRSTPASVGLMPFGSVHRLSAEGVHIPGVPRRMAQRTPQFAAVMSAIIALSSVQALIQHLPNLAELADLDLAAVGTIISFQSLAMVVIPILLGAACDRFGLTPMLWVCVVGQAIALVALVFVGGYVPFLVTVIVLSLGIGVGTVMAPMLVVQIFGPKEFAAILGPLMAALPAGLAVGAPLWGAVYDAAGNYAAGLWLGLVVTLLSGLAATWALRTGPSLRARVAEELGEPY